MFTRPKCCPNPNCSHHENPQKGFYLRRGTYRTKHDLRDVPRYSCKGCGRWFNSRSLGGKAGQHKPQINKAVMGLICSGVTIRRAAVLVGVARKTVDRKVRWLSEQARKAHLDFLARDSSKTGYVQMDEMETYEHSTLKPLSIILAVRPKTGQIISASVAPMNCHGVMAGKSRDIYGVRADRRNEVFRESLRSVMMVAKHTMTISTDGKDTYRPAIREMIPSAVHEVHGRPKISKIDRPPKKWDPLYCINQTSAKLRADLSRLARQTWSATKRASALADHLAIYIAFNNGYEIA